MQGLDTACKLVLMDDQVLLCVGRKVKVKFTQLKVLSVMSSNSSLHVRV